MSKFRYRIVQVFLVLAFFLIAGRLAQFQILDAKKYRHSSQKAAKINQSRGEIVDRNSKVLALDLNKYTLEYNPLEVEEDRKALALKLSRIFNFKNTKLLYSQASQTLTHNLNKKQAQQIRKLNSKLLYLRRIKSRFYPQGHLASHLIGYVDLYGKARQGVESKYNDYLLEDAEKSLQLSIDSRLQAFAEKTLRQRIIATKAERGAVLVMKVDTGEMLAWAVNPDFDPNKYYEFSVNQRKNWSLVDVYQPGSIFKIITVATALDSSTVTPDYTYMDIGYLEVDKWKIKNHDYNKETKKEKLTLQKLFERSSNPFAAHLGLEIGRETFYKYIRKFGFGDKTGVELSGETRGILHKFTKWRNSDTATTGMGQGAISVTPIQLLSGINVVANKGTWVRPSILKFKPGSSTVNNVNTRSVISPEVATHVSKLLANAIDHNLKFKQAIAGRIDDLRIAGKTGTASKIKAGGGYSKRNTVASFLGFFPAQKPRYIMLVVIDDPQTDGRWGDTVAGPVFNKITEYMKSLYL